MKERNAATHSVCQATKIGVIDFRRRRKLRFSYDHYYLLFIGFAAHFIFHFNSVVIAIVNDDAAQTSLSYKTDTFKPTREMT